MRTKFGGLNEHTSKSSNIFLNPVHSETLVTEPKIRLSSFNDFLASEETPRAKTVVGADCDDGVAILHTPLHNEAQVVTLIYRAAFEKTTSVDPESYWKARILVSRRSDNVEVQTVL